MKGVFKRVITGKKEHFNINCDSCTGRSFGNRSESKFEKLKFKPVSETLQGALSFNNLPQYKLNIV